MASSIFHYVSLETDCDPSYQRGERWGVSGCSTSPSLQWGSDAKRNDGGLPQCSPSGEQEGEESAIAVGRLVEGRQKKKNRTGGATGFGDSKRGRV